MRLEDRQALATRAQALNETMAPATVLLVGIATALACFATSPSAGHRVADDGSGIVPTFRVTVRVKASLVTTAPKAGQHITLTIAGTARTVCIESANKETAEVHWRIVATAPTA